MDQNREFCCSKSRLAVLKIPGGLDRSWETKRLQGLEMLGQSVELQKERSNQKNVFQENPTKKKSRHKKRHGATVAKAEVFRELHETDSNEIVKLRMQEDYVLKLEYHLQELSQQLIVERQKNRQEKLYIARLQQDLARLKSERPFKEMLAKELEKEHKLRLEAEHRLSRLTVEYRSCKDRTLSLENDLKKMSDFAQGLSVYKSKLEEQQMDGLSSGGLNGNGVHCDDNEKTKVLLERLRRLEAEKTSLVLENENQSQSYEKCLDEITGQVLEALMSQRSLKEECIKLQNRVFNLQQQNMHLRKVFQPQFILNPDATCLEQVMTADGKSKSKLRFPFMGVSLSSLNSVFSDQDQMSCLLSQINSPSIDLQDCLTEIGAMDIVLDAALGRDCAAVLNKDDSEKEEEGEGGTTNGRQLEKAPLLLPNDNKTTGHAFGTRGGGENLISSDLSNPVVEWSQLVSSKFSPVLGTESQSKSQTPEHSSGAAQKFRNRSSNFLSPRKERTNGELLKQFRNGEFSAEDFVVDKGLSFGRSFDTLDTAASDQMSQANVHLDTGSTVSLNELLDLAVVDLDDDLGASTETRPDREDEAAAAAAEMPLTEEEEEEAGGISRAGSSDVASDDVSIPKDGRDIQPFPEHNIKMLLPDVCPDYSRNLKRVV